MAAITHDIDVNAPLRVVYDQWTQFEEFPRFMEGIVEVRQEDDKRLYWRAKIGGKEKEWRAEIIEQVPDIRVAWRGIDGAPNTGKVFFQALDAQRTKVTLTMEYEPEGFVEKAGDALGVLSARVKGDLKRFRDFIEERGRQTGGWRGQIGGGASSTTAAVRTGPQEAPVRATDETTTALTVRTSTRDPLSEGDPDLARRLISGEEEKN